MRCFNDSHIMAHQMPPVSAVHTITPVVSITRRALPICMQLGQGEDGRQGAGSPSLNTSRAPLVAALAALRILVSAGPARIHP